MIYVLGLIKMKKLGKINNRETISCEFDYLYTSDSTEDNPINSVYLEYLGMKQKDKKIKEGND